MQALFDAQTHFSRKQTRRKCAHMRTIDRIRAILSLKPWTQQRVAEELGVSQSTVNRWVKGAEPEGHNRDALLALHARLFNGQNPNEPFAVPLLSWVSAGKLEEADSVENHEIRQVMVADLPRGNYIALQVDGDSMDRVAPQGSILIVDRNDRDLRDRQYYIVAGPAHEVTFKRFRDDPPRLEPYSTNPDHEPIFPGEDGFRVIGRVRRVNKDLDEQVWQK